MNILTSRPGTVAALEAALTLARTVADEEAQIDAEIAIDNGTEVTEYEAAEMLAESLTYSEIGDPELRDAYRVEYLRTLLAIVPGGDPLAVSL